MSPVSSSIDSRKIKRNYIAGFEKDSPQKRQDWLERHWALVGNSADFSNRRLNFQPFLEANEKVTINTKEIIRLIKGV